MRIHHNFRKKFSDVYSPHVTTLPPTADIFYGQPLIMFCYAHSYEATTVIELKIANLKKKTKCLKQTLVLDGIFSAGNAAASSNFLGGK